MESESEIKLNPALKWIIILLIAFIAIWVWANRRMEAIQENLATLKQEYDSKLELLRNSVQRKALLDKKVLAVFRWVVLTSAFCLSALLLFVINQLDWTLSEWSDFLGVIQPLILLTGLLIIILFQKNITVFTLLELIRKKIKILVYQYYQFDKDALSQLECEVIGIKKETKRLELLLAKFEYWTPFPWR